MVINVINLGPHQPTNSMNPNISVGQIKRFREERVLSICQQSKDQGFYVRFWEGEYDKEGFVGVNRAFKNIVRYARDEDLPYVIIAEDDMVFTGPGAWKYYKSKMPYRFDMYLGGIYSGTVSEGRVISGYSGNTLVTVHRDFYDFFLSVTDLDHLDRRLGSFAHEKIYLVCEPYVVKQLEGFSDNHRRETKHSGYLDGVKLFGAP